MAGLLLVHSRIYDNVLSVNEMAKSKAEPVCAWEEKRSSFSLIYDQLSFCLASISISLHFNY